MAEDFPWIKRVSLTIELDGESFVDNKDLRCAGLLTKMAATLSAPKSACPSPGDFLDAFECGADDIYVVTLSDKVSGTYASAVIAADMFKKNHPERNIFVFSSRSAAAGEIAICEALYEKASTGAAFDDVVKLGLEFIDDLSTYFLLEDLDVLRKNGRLSHLQSIVTGALRLKLIMGADDTGNICQRGKALSMDRAIQKMSELITHRCTPEKAKTKRLYITQCQCPERARKARDLIMQKTPFKDCLIMRSSGISTIYANTGGFIVAF